MRNFILACMFVLAGAVQAAPAVPDAALEEHVMALSEELRCLVCQNQTIADSNAELAIDLRNQVREQLVQGKSDQDVIAYMVQRYGDFVLYRPPVKGTTGLLWFGPFVLMAGGVFLLVRMLRRARAQPEEPPQGDMARAAQLLAAGTNLKETP